MITFCRVDERLLHGQIAVNWMGHTKSNRIAIVDDGTAANAMFTRMFKSMAPRGTSVDVLSVAQAKDALQADPYTGKDRVMILAKVPGVFLELQKAGVEIPELNVGNMGVGKDRKKLLATVWVTEQEKQDFRDLLASGINVYAQLMPRDGKKDLASLVG